MIARPTSDIKYIVIHHSVTPPDYTLEDIRNIHLNSGYVDIGYHYFVNEKGMRRGRNHRYIGAHCLPDKPPYSNYSMNRISIGVVIPGDYTKGDPTPKLINELAYAVKVLCRLYKLPLDRAHVIGHKEASYTACPGNNTMSLLYKKLNI